MGMQATSGASASGPWSNLIDDTLTAAETTHSMTVDLTADYLYEFYFQVNNTAGAEAICSLYCNADTTATNYRVQQSTSSGAAISTVNAAVGQIGTVPNGDSGILWGHILRDAEGYPRAEIFNTSGPHAALYYRHTAWRWNAITDVATLLLASNTANSLGIGSRFIIHKYEG